MVKKKREREKKSSRKINLKNIILIVVVVLAVLLALYMVFYPKIKNDEKIKLEPPSGTKLFGECIGGYFETFDCKLKLYKTIPIFYDHCQIIPNSNPQEAKGNVGGCKCRYHDPLATCKLKADTPEGSEPTDTTGWCSEEKETIESRTTTTITGTGNDPVKDCNRKANTYCDIVCPDDVGTPRNPPKIRCCIKAT